MKVEIFENEHGLSIDIQPETVEESNKLLRFANNVKSEKPSVVYYFSGNSPTLSVWMKKVKESVQVNSIRKYQ